MECYIEALCKQFKSAKGYTYGDLSSKYFNDEFLWWLLSRQKLISEYIKFLEKLELDKIKTNNTLEIGKGVYDSVGKYFNTKIITPYAFDFYKSCNIISGEFFVFNGLPVINNGLIRIINSCNTDKITFMTQNPYINENIYGWDSLANSNKYDLVLGVYGENDDKDKASKIKLLREFKNKLLVDNKEEYMENNDLYYYVISTGNEVDKLLEINDKDLAKDEELIKVKKRYKER